MTDKIDKKFQRLWEEYHIKDAKKIKQGKIEKMLFGQPDFLNPKSSAYKLLYIKSKLFFLLGINYEQKLILNRKKAIR